MAAPMALAQAELFEPDMLEDALGEAYSQEHRPEARREHGITLTPAWLVECMLDLAARRGGFDTIVDCGAGTGRFAIEAARRFPQARVIAVEAHPEMAAMLRWRIRERSLGGRILVVEADFRAADLPLQGRTLFIGNPPYVRHHDIEIDWKAWYRERMAQWGIAASRLAGLHAQFMLRAAEAMRPGDAMLFVTAAEWLDNGYGDALRKLCAATPGFALRSLWLAPPQEPVFADALVSSVVVELARASDTPAVQCGLIAGRRFEPVRLLGLAALAGAPRWSPLCREAPLADGAGIELGELFRVVRGQLTGKNEVWVVPAQSPLPARLTVAAVTRAREVIDGVAVAADALTRLRRVVDLPRDLQTLTDFERGAADRFLADARAAGADAGYIARHRNPWYRVEMRAPPVAFVSYMGRRPPVFCANPHRVSYINIAHGLYPREAVTQPVLERLLQWLNTGTDIGSGRVYGGGLAKFEPSDVARLRVPASLLASTE